MEEDCCHSFITSHPYYPSVYFQIDHELRRKSSCLPPKGDMTCSTMILTIQSGNEGNLYVHDRDVMQSVLVATGCPCGQSSLRFDNINARYRDRGVERNRRATPLVHVLFASVDRVQR